MKIDPTRTRMQPFCMSSPKYGTNATTFIFVDRLKQISFVFCLPCLQLLFNILSGYFLVYFRCVLWPLSFDTPLKSACWMFSALVPKFLYSLMVCLLHKLFQCASIFMYRHIYENHGNWNTIDKETFTVIVFLKFMDDSFYFNCLLLISFMFWYISVIVYV
jgi:hypothetical protein